MSGATPPPPPPCALMVRTGKPLPFYIDKILLYTYIFSHITLIGQNSKLVKFYMKLDQPVFLELKTEKNSPLQLPISLRNN